MLVFIWGPGRRALDPADETEAVVWSFDSEMGHVEAVQLELGHMHMHIASNFFFVSSH